LLDRDSAADAPTVYYALYHDPNRSALLSRMTRMGGLGFVGRFQTGIDLFRPVIAMRCWQAEIAAQLLAKLALSAALFAF